MIRVQVGTREHRCVLERDGARIRLEAGHPSRFTAWDFTVAWNQASESQGIGSRREADSQSDFSLSQHRGSAFEPNETCVT